MNTLNLNGREYTYHQYRELAENDDNPLNPLFDWFSNSKEGEFTYHYSYVIFHTEDDRFACAYKDNITNYWFV